MDNTTVHATKGNSCFTTKSITLMGLFAAILCISAYCSFPLPIPGSPHITLQNFVIILIALLFPMSQSFLIILVWMILGALGLPVFVGGAGGIGYIVSPWGGYTFTFLLIALLLPIIRRKKYNRIAYTITAVIGVLLIDFLGLVWLQMNNHLPWSVAFFTGFLDFLPLDLAKAVIAAQIIPAFRAVIHETNRE